MWTFFIPVSGSATCVSDISLTLAIKSTQSNQMNPAKVGFFCLKKPVDTGFCDFVITIILYTHEQSIHEHANKPDKPWVLL